MTYCFPVNPIVTTRIKEAVPMTIPRAVRAKRTLLLMKVSYAKLRISPRHSFGLRRVVAGEASKGLTGGCRVVRPVGDAVVAPMLSTFRCYAGTAGVAITEP